jgi:hypothetical protein
MDMQSIRTRLVLAATVVMVATPVGIQAQSEPAACQAAVATLRGHVADQSALFAISRCPSAGPPELVSLWARQDLTSPAIATLADATGSLRDARMLEAVTKAASERSRPAASRLAALQVLMRYYDPRYAPTAEDLRGMTMGSPVPVRIGGAPPIDGTSPLPANTRARVGAKLAALAATDPDAEVRQAALRLRQALAIEDPANTPLSPNSVSLIAGCGTRVTLRSTADVSLPVRVTVPSSNFEHTYSIRGGSVTKPSDLLLSLTAGTVIASYGGREIARLSERKAVCPPGMPR